MACSSQSKSQLKNDNFLNIGKHKKQVIFVCYILIKYTKMQFAIVSLM